MIGRTGNNNRYFVATWMPSKEWFDFTAQGVTDREELPMPPSGIVFLFDVDNTLLDNDRVTEDLQRYL